MRWTGWGPWNLRNDMAVSSLRFLFALYISRVDTGEAHILEVPTGTDRKQP